MGVDEYVEGECTQMIARLIFHLWIDIDCSSSHHIIRFCYAKDGLRFEIFEHTNIIRLHPNSPMELLNYSLTNQGTPKTLL